MSGLVRTRSKAFSFSSYHWRNDFSRQSVILCWICAGWVCICWAAVQRRTAEGLTEPVWSLLKTESEHRPPNPHLHRRQRDEERWRKVVQIWERTRETDKRVRPETSFTQVDKCRRDKRRCERLTNAFQEHILKMVINLSTPEADINVCVNKITN